MRLTQTMEVAGRESISSYSRPIGKDKVGIAARTSRPPTCAIFLLLFVCFCQLAMVMLFPSACFSRCLHQMRQEVNSRTHMGLDQTWLSGLCSSSYCLQGSASEGNPLNQLDGWVLLMRGQLSLNMAVREEVVWPPTANGCQLSRAPERIAAAS